MMMDDRINLLAKVARTEKAPAERAGSPDRSILMLAAASYGARPWQIELTAGPVAQALGEAKNEVPDAADADTGDT